MTNTNLFEVAVREKLRFTYKGYLSTEDVWDLSVSELDTIFKSLNSQLKQAQEESLLNTKTAEDVELDTKIEIIKHIFNVKVAEANARLQDKEKAEKKQQILGLIKKKQDEATEEKSVEELLEELAKLED